jgi:hypothetical protein
LAFFRPALLTMGVTAIAAGLAQAVSEVPFGSHHVAGHAGHVMALVGMLLVFAAVLIDAHRTAGARRSERKDGHAQR